MRYRYRKDDELKDSGVEWIGKIPKDWEVKKVKHVFEEISEKNYSEDAELLSLYTHLGVKSQKELEARGNKAQTVIEYKIVKKNDIVVNKMLAWMGAIGMSEYNGVISPAYNIYRKYNKDVETRFYHHLFRTKRFANECYKNGWGIMLMRWTTTPERFKDIYIPYIPNLDKKIANFLDKKTSQFDLIISKKEKLIERLEEAKKSLISEVVTGKVKVVKTDDGYELVKRCSEEMKDSGIEWLGEIPKDWEVKKIKYTSKIYRGKFNHRPRNDPDYYDGKYPFIQTGDVANSGMYISKYTQTLNEKGYSVSKEFPKGTLVMTIAANIGDIAILNFNACFPDSIVGFTPNKFMDLKYMYYTYAIMKDEFMSTAIINTQMNLNIERIENLSITVPSIDIQNIIVKYIEQKVNSIELSINKTKLQIEKLKEAKQSLISEAVTGKIEILD